jgi:hypothetical protein
MMRAEAYFDAAYLAQALPHVEEGLPTLEIHLFAYLSCAMSLFDGVPVAQWGYSFASTPHGAPFSSDVEAALNALLARGLVAQRGVGTLEALAACSSEVAELASFSLNRRRVRYLRAACDAALAVPITKVHGAVVSDPEIGPARALESSRTLLSGPGIGVMHECFRALRDAFPVRSGGELGLPAIAWVSYLAQESGG